MLILFGALTALAGPPKTLVVAIPSAPSSLNPLFAGTALDSQLTELIGLPVIDASFKCSLQFEPGLATSWSWSEDGRILSVTLRDDVRWSDGVLVTADDLAFTYELLADPIVASGRERFIADMRPDARPRVLDATHLEWEFTRSFDHDAQLAYTLVQPVPRHVLGDADRSTLRGHAYSLAPLSTGPWSVESSTKGEEVVLVRNRAYSGPRELRPRLKRIVFRILPEYEVRLDALQRGEVDVMDAVRIEDLASVRAARPDVQLHRRGYRAMDYVAWNLQDPRFSDVRVRRALAQAVDVDGIIAKMFTDEAGVSYAQRAVGTFTPELCAIGRVPPVPYDVQAARTLLAEAGWTDSNGDGTVDRDGQEFRFTLITNGENLRRRDAVIRLQAAFLEIGVEVVLEALPFDEVSRRLRSHDFDAVLGGWAAALFVDPTDIWHSPAGAGAPFNFGTYQSPVADALIERGVATQDPKAAAPIWSELQAVIYEDQPYLFLWWLDDVVAIDGRFEPAPPSLLSPLEHLEAWR